ncbi:hypothetical protein RND81_14G135000 [Saponaria officinalis]|uniref:Uncharacterized protein n=1 Tax=Saponaria officinalis TaxID=3572 RepID=A0AAW1GPV8_SAPOF
MNYSSYKRKERENPSFYTHHNRGSFVNKHQYQYQLPNKNNITGSKHTTPFAGSSRLFSEPGLAPSNRILAGYMAQEYLTKGTLFGQKFDPARAEAVPVSAAEPKRKPGLAEPVGLKPNRGYAEVAQILMGCDGAHIPGIVNPTQLARWIQM